MLRTAVKSISLTILTFFMYSGFLWAQTPMVKPVIVPVQSKTIPTPPPPPPLVMTTPMIGQMVWVKGDVKAISLEQKARTLQRQSPVYQGDTIETGTAGSGQIVFTDGSLLVLRGGTDFKVDQYHYDKKGKPADNHFIGNFIKGGFRTITGLIAHTHYDGYAVKTPVATIGVRGTEYVAVLGSNGLTAQTLRDPIIVTNQAGQVTLDPEKEAAVQISGLNFKPEVMKSAPANITESLPAPTPAPAPTPPASSTPSSSDQNTTTTGGSTTSTGSSSGGGDSGGSSGGSSSGTSSSSTSSGGSSSSTTSSSGGTNVPASDSGSQTTTVDTGSNNGSPSLNTNKIVNCIQLKAN